MVKMVGLPASLAKMATRRKRAEDEKAGRQITRCDGSREDRTAKASQRGICVAMIVRSTQTV